MTHHRPIDILRSGDVVAGPTAGRERRPELGRGHARPLQSGDLEAVGDIFLRVFRGMTDRSQRAAALPALVDHLDGLYLGSPWHQPELGSLVYLDASGDLVGFLGSVEMHMLFEGARLTAGAMGTFMVADPRHDTQAALVLMRHHLANGLDVHFSDTANRTSLEFSRPMRFELMAQHSLEWVYALRPASLALSRVRRRWPLLPAGLAAPIARGLDEPTRRLIQGRDRLGHDDRVTVTDMDPQAFLAAAPTHVADRRLRPDWTADELGWLLAQARLRTGNGPLHIRVAHDADGTELGFWLIYAEPGGIAAVLQVFARPRRDRAVIQALIADAEAMGCLAVRGGTEPRLMEALYAVPGLIFHHKGATSLRSRHRCVMEAVRAGDVAIGGLTGESWTRLVSDRF